MNVKEANELIRYTSDVLDKQISDRGLLESQLFPVTAYICVAFYNTYDMLYDILKKVSEKTTPEVMGKESRKILSELQALTITYIPLYYMEGRMGEIHRRGGEPKNEPEEKRKETLFILDFWKRLASSYYPSGKIFVTGDENNTNYALENPDIDWTLNNIKETNSQEVKLIKRTLANLEVVSFLDECEARAKLCDHGPYRLNDEEILVFREISHLYDGGKPHFPWSETKAKSPYPNIAFALRLKNVKAEFDNFATMMTDPKTFTEHITGAALITRDGDKLYPLDFSILEDFNVYSNQAQKELYIKFSKWDRRERLLAGAYAYCYGFARYTNFVGITNEIDWNLTERTMEKYIPHFMENDFDPAISRHFRTPRKKKKGGPSLYLLAEE
jgi:hypothetical protein